MTTPTRESSQGVFTYLANARYHFTDEATGYVRYATGYRPGGPNYVLNDPATGQPVGPSTFEPDRLASYEAGFKTEVAERRFGIDAALYYINWKDMHVATVAGGFSVIANAGAATVRGAELTLTGHPTRDFMVTGAFAYQRAYLTEDAADLGGKEGERLPNVPRFTAALNADYSVRSLSLLPAVGASVRYVTDRFSSFDGSTSFAQYRLPAYTTVDVRSGMPVGPVSLQVYVHNLFDRHGELSAFSAYSAPGTTSVSILTPRTIGISAATHF